MNPRPAPILLLGASLFILHPSSFILSAQDPSLTTHASSKPLASNAVTAPWPRFLGPAGDGTTPESPLLDGFPETGPTLLWERVRGSGYAGVTAAAGALFHFHRLEGNETLECLDAETGTLRWATACPIQYRDRYGFSDGPRASPVLDGEKIYTLGVTGVLQCRGLAGGELLWERDLTKDFAAPLNFFGFGTSPLVLDEKLIVNVGGQACVVAFHKDTGKIIWQTPHDKYDASYASPVTATLNGKLRLLVYAGGESRPSTGGLLLIDPAGGGILDDFPWRAEVYESVIASTPRPVGGDRVYISECYENGGVMLQVTREDKFKIAWKAPAFGMHWMVPHLHEGNLYGFPGRNEPDTSLSCYAASDGKKIWSDPLTWKEDIDGRQFGWGYYRASLIRTGPAGNPRWLCLGEMGTLAWLEITPEGVKETSKASLFASRHAWTMPTIHKGLLYATQNEPGLSGDTPRRLLCYDLRGE